jgi:transposase-like protein
MAKPIPDRPKRRQFTDEFRREAVQMMLDGLSASAVAERLGLADPTLLYVWKKKLVTREDRSRARSTSASGTWKPSCSASSGSGTS